MDYKVSNDVMDVYLNANPSVIIHMLLQKVRRVRKGKRLLTVADYSKMIFSASHSIVYYL